MAGVELASRTGRGIVTAAVLGSGMAFLDGTVVNVALVRIGTDLDASLADLQWVSNGYLLSLASLILLGGSLGDRFGRRRIFVLGVIGFAVASALCGAAPTPGLLIAARVLQGVAGALLTPGSLSMIEATDPPRGPRPGDRVVVGPRRRRRRHRARSSAGGSCSTRAGGGPSSSTSRSRVVTVLLARRYVPETRDEQAERGRFDVLGAVLATATLALTTYALIQYASLGPVRTTVLVVAGVRRRRRVRRRRATRAYPDGAAVAVPRPPVHRRPTS